MANKRMSGPKISLKVGSGQRLDRDAIKNQKLQDLGRVVINPPQPPKPGGGPDLAKLKSPRG